MTLFSLTNHETKTLNHKTRKYLPSKETIIRDELRVENRHAVFEHQINRSKSFPLAGQSPMGVVVTNFICRLHSHWPRISRASFDCYSQYNTRYDYAIPLMNCNFHKKYLLRFISSVRDNSSKSSTQNSPPLIQKSIPLDFVKTCTSDMDPTYHLP